MAACVMKHPTSNHQPPTSNEPKTNHGFEVGGWKCDSRGSLPAIALLLFCALALHSARAADTPLVSHADTWHYHKGTNAPQANWPSLPGTSLDATWSVGNGGFGYADNTAETNDCQTLLPDMRNGYTTIYLRRTFSVTNVIDPGDHLKLTMDWDDGFVAYLDGGEVHREFAPGAVGIEPAFNAVATSGHESSAGNTTPQPVQTYDLGPVGSQLPPGAHVLAIIGLNAATNSSDCILIADLAYGPQVCPSNTICSDTNWTLSGSPYVVTNLITIAPNVTLTIAAGVTIQLALGAGITIQGHLISEGTSANPVSFRSLDGTNNWDRLGATGNNASLTLRHADVEHGQTAVLGGASGLFEACYFHDYHVTGTPTLYNQPILVSEQAPSLIVRACHFRNYYETLFRLGVIVIEDSLFEDVTGDAVDFDTASPGSVIRRCTLRHGPLTNVDAIDLGSDSGGVLVENCLMYDFPFDKGVSIGEHSTNITVRGCVIYAVDMGVAVKDSSDALIVQNTIADSNFGLRLYEKTTGQGGGHAASWNNILWNNTNSIVLLNGSTISVDFSDVSGGVYPGTSNFDTNPLFLNAASNDYRLAPNSPCLGAGTNGTTTGALFPVGSYLVDTDGDGVPDTWEETYNLDFNNAADASSDADHDGLTNLQEFWAGTNPGDAGSNLKLAAAALSGANALVLSFQAISNRSYTVESRTAFDPGIWTTLLAFPPASTNRFIQSTNATDNGESRFYRLIVLAD
jgi:hypothetical protein